MKQLTYKPIYNFVKGKPMHVIVFASGSGGNLQSAINLSLQKPDLIKVGLVITDRLGIRAIDIARQYKIPIIASDFEKKCGVWKDCKVDSRKIQQYEINAVQYHNAILKQILRIEKNNKTPFDLAVLSYHRWIHGDLYDYFYERMINQHAGDLTVMNKNNTRRFIGINPVLYALKTGEKKTRTSTFIVRDGHDNGEILCQGPWVTYVGSYPITVTKAYKQELIQKRKSDWPSLSFALQNIAKGHCGLAKNLTHKDGNKVIVYKGKPLGYGGVDLGVNTYELSPYNV